ncbi:MAG TPA: hypothetical protein VE954_31135 [Oligoflexus sp.]|uniref:hypothetical protein n=1 Tax=Oligoflexus sp. TaxID=1971216 RepID=UPI002D36C6BD|nr:hypothetical protein [Oligoflexus sp.]HYX37578.1 hypothetical protein [Oligoflexus sp.]
MRLAALLLIVWLAPPPVQAQGKAPAGSDYGPAQVLQALRLLREQRGDPNPPKLNVCLRNSTGGRWSDLQAHFYCWLKPDQRACFTGAVDGEFKDHPELKGNYDLAYGHCQEAKGRAYGINFDRPLARLSIEQGEVFKNLLYRRPNLTKDEQRKILEAFYAEPMADRKTPVPVATERKPAANSAPLDRTAATERKPAANSAPLDRTSAADNKTATTSASEHKAVVPPGPAPERKPAVMAPVPASAPVPSDPVPPPVVTAPTMVNPDIGDMENSVPAEKYPRACQLKNGQSRARQKPDSTSPIVAILDPIPIEVTGPAQSSSGTDTKLWYPVAFQYRGKALSAWLSVSLVDCPK